MKKVFGILILAVGIIFFLSNTGFIETNASSIFSTFWPVLIILIGLKVLFEGIIYFFQNLKRDKLHVGKVVFGILLTAIGVVLLGNNAGWFSFGFGDLWSWTWPILLIYIGFKVIFDRNGDVVIHLDMGDKGKKDDFDDDDNKYDDKKQEKKIKIKKKRKANTKHHTVVGEIQLGRTPFEVDGADISMGVGSVEIDLTKAILKDGENVIDIRSWVGSVEILVPKDMAIKAVADVRIGEVTLFDDTYSGTSRSATYTSPNFYEADKKVIMYVNLNIGDVEVLTVG
ncbi:MULTISPECIES: cell wall-active antibiotics response protein LiaF [Bacillaceae]|uniref:Cell wall-active antibiotics response protein n=1 Tax=Evansella alkalicola TaxID=745819 RepID=A0ABS6JUN6_9BACI|nr:MULTISPECIES: cell wall-active antibiotics response protein LiaF [Bacillaceae]MBU9721801.1 cell wall-active antibiotics response protein [Bacillus alkalicola]